MTEESTQEDEDADATLDSILTLSTIYFNLSQRGESTQAHILTLDNIERDISLLYQSLTNEQAEQ